MRSDGPDPDPVVPAEQIAAVGASVTLLDVRWVLGRADGHEQFLAGHVPGAAYVDMEADLCDPVGDGSRGRHPLPHPDRFAAAMRRCGVRRSRRVVVYDDVAGAAATRAWWLLTYHGHPDVKVVDGGFTDYVDAGGEVETGEPPVAPGDFVADPGHLPLLDAAGAARVAREALLIDVRAAERYRGENEPIDPVAGHIPGAVNAPYLVTNLVTPPGGRRPGFRAVGDLRALYEQAGLRPDVEVGVYCGSGVTATHTAFALHRLGVTAALYSGSWSEWVADPERPVETGA